MDQGLMNSTRPLTCRPISPVLFLNQYWSISKETISKTKNFHSRKMLMILYDMMCRHIIVIKDTTEDFSVMDTIVNVLKKNAISMINAFVNLVDMVKERVHLACIHHPGINWAELCPWSRNKDFFQVDNYENEFAFGYTNKTWFVFSIALFDKQLPWVINGWTLIKHIFGMHMISFISCIL